MCLSVAILVALIYCYRVLYWMKPKEPFKDQSQNEHRIGLIFASDVCMAGFIFNQYPHAKYSLVTSLNHSVWFENDADINQWNLFDGKCLSSTNGVTLNISRYS